MYETLELNFDISYENDSTSNYLVLKPKNDRKLIDYQVQMLLNNRIHGLLSLHINSVGNQVNCFYDITSKCTLVNIMNRKKYNRYEFLITMLTIIKSIIGLKDYLLNDNNILLDENNIYVDPEALNLFFVYLPFENNSNDIRTFLINIIVKLVKFQEEDCDNYIQKILENIKNELFNLTCLKELLENLLSQDITRNTPNESFSIDKPENEPLNEIKIKASKQKQKSLIQRGEVKIPNLPSEECSPKNLNIKHKDFSKAFGKLTLMQIILQPIILLILFKILSSNFVRMSDSPKTTTIILSLIFISIDILLIRILNEKKTENTESYKPLQYITEKMRENSALTVKQASEKDSKKAEEVHIKNINNRGGETVILKSNEPKDIPYLQEKDGEDIIKVNKTSILVGRMGSFVDHIVDNNAVGKVHAEIINEDGSYFVMDCSSRNGTYINDGRIKPNTKTSVNNNDVIRFANKEFIFIIPS
ncbi:DUF6382 domain-containing protein [Ruminiclostridium cellulolyticum]|uniref:FHA domain containing protein n=1 Tax=Ruminiclostridium cellulolyticum (strain ATCC 35319 / DSM 5812 / JCM 6584 / H10) TaxID=394503 RepID=B8I6K1_RUMCH|nr:DUF6382 domain-containing protein [Ruminiclostridium cellulolyticum]ACL74893.1 FHA domain containing protein [Ruminiclostridium cellulolyticum H10]